MKSKDEGAVTALLLLAFGRSTEKSFSSCLRGWGVSFFGLRYNICGDLM
jgi:hypothetical protein